MSSQMVFKRYELKYLLNRQQKEAVLEAMAPYMELDRYGRSTIRNIYYDTNNYRLIRKSLEKPVYKEKLRVRSYHQAESETKVFVELKKKYDAVVYKRRMELPLKQVQDYLAGKTEGMLLTSFRERQITEEIQYFMQFYQDLSPKVFLSYEREAYYTKEKSEFRVTFDENILWREEDLSLEKGVYGEPVLAPGLTLMEIKTPGGIPLWMVDVMSREGIRKTSFSKYGNAYRGIMERERGELNYA